MWKTTLDSASKQLTRSTLRQSWEWTTTSLRAKQVMAPVEGGSRRRAFACTTWPRPSRMMGCQFITLALNLTLTWDLLILMGSLIRWKNIQRYVQRFRVRHGLSCVFGPVWPVGAGCYSKAALPMPLSKRLYAKIKTKVLTLDYPGLHELKFTQWLFVHTFLIRLFENDCLQQKYSILYDKKLNLIFRGCLI